MRKVVGLSLLIAAFCLLSASDTHAESLSDHINDLLNSGNSDLIIDETPDHNIRYIGSNPANLVYFNDELWYIIGVFNGKIKLMRKEALGYLMYDSSDISINNGGGVNEWSQSKLMNELNGDYLNLNLTEDTLWYSKHSNQRTFTFDHTKVINQKSQNYIVDNIWPLGAMGYNSETGQYYTQYTHVKDSYAIERGTQTGKVCTGEYASSEFCNDTVMRTTSWTGKVGLIYGSDIIYSVSDSDAITRSECLEKGSYAFSNKCYKNSYLGKLSGTTISPAVKNGYGNQTVMFSWGDVAITELIGFRGNMNVFPALFISSDTPIIGGSGTVDNPYYIYGNTVRFETNGGSSVADQKVVPSGNANEPEAPSKANSNFAGWYEDEGLTIKFDFTTPITSDKVLYAKYTALPAVSTNISPETPATSKNIDSNPETSDNIDGYVLLLVTTSASLVAIKYIKKYAK